MTDPKKIYWDACVWLSLINQEVGKAERCEYLIELAREGKVEIWTSSLSLAEVFKKKCEGKNIALAANNDLQFENFIQQDFLVEVQLDHDIATEARRLLRAHPELKKPTDGIHLATATTHNIDEFHTFDVVNLLRLNGQITMHNGVVLTICEPPDVPPPSLPVPLPPLPLFEQLGNDTPVSQGLGPA